MALDVWTAVEAAGFGRDACEAALRGGFFPALPVLRLAAGLVVLLPVFLVFAIDALLSRLCIL